MPSSELDSRSVGPGSHRGPLYFPLVRLSTRTLVQRVLLLALLFVSELITISVWLDGAYLVHRTGLIGFMHDWGAWILRCVVGFPIMFLTFAYFRNKAALERISSQIEGTSIRWRLLAVHCFAMVVFVALSFLIYEHGGSGSRSDVLAAIWFIAGIAAIAFAGFSLLSWTIYAQLIRSTGHLWIYASMAVVSACIGGNLVRKLWKPVTSLTLYLTKMFLDPFVSGVIANPVTRVIGTQRFHVEIAPECSGLEGIGLILAFGILWLLIFRKRCQFPRSLVLIPFGIAVIFLLNAVRIAALILIGNAGAEQVALGGFHSQAGWIAFSAVSVGFCFVIQRVPWFTTRQQSWESFRNATHNPSAGYLVPFLMILAAGMIAGAAKGAGSVEWLYFLRLLAGGGMLWFYRRKYASMSWGFDWVAPTIGLIVFVMWIGLDRFSNPIADHDMSSALMASSALTRGAWITCRVLAAVVTVPLAEELAFRGYLMRRLLSRDFESVSFKRFSWVALLVSSAAFGLLHGGYWIAGSFAGILFGLTVIRRGRIGEAVVAHSTANALLALYVLEFHKWHLW